MVAVLSDNPREAPPPVRLILASESPRRAELLRAHGYRFEIVHPPLPEPSEAEPARDPASWAEALSYFKARSVADEALAGVVLAADTITVSGGRIFGKPRDRADAARILGALTGTTHEVITGVTVMDAATRRRVIAHEVTHVTLRAMTGAELEEYLDSGAWTGKAGAYGIQDHGDRFVTRCGGSFSNVVGLPIELVGRLLSGFGVFPVAAAAPPDA